MAKIELNYGTPSTKISTLALSCCLLTVLDNMKADSLSKILLHFGPSLRFAAGQEGRRENEQQP